MVRITTILKLWTGHLEGEEPYFGDLPNHLTNWDDPSSKGPTPHRKKSLSLEGDWICRVESSQARFIPPRLSPEKEEQPNKMRRAVAMHGSSGPGAWGGHGLIEKYGTQRWSWFGVHHEAPCYMGKSTLKWDWQVLSYCPLVMQGVSVYFLGLFQVIMANPVFLLTLLMSYRCRNITSLKVWLRHKMWHLY